MFSKKNFSKRLKELRVSKNLTLEELGEQVNAAKQTVGHWETGYRIPTIDVVMKLANYYGVSLDYLLGATDFPYPLSEKVVNIINQASNPEEIIAIIQELNQMEKNSQTAEQSGSNEINDLIKDLDEDSIKELKKYADYLKVRQTLDKGDNESSAGLDTASGK